MIELYTALVDFDLEEACDSVRDRDVSHWA
jgi:hypothetical protein